MKTLGIDKITPASYGATIENIDRTFLHNVIDAGPFTVNDKIEQFFDKKPHLTNVENALLTGTVGNRWRPSDFTLFISQQDKLGNPNDISLSKSFAPNALYPKVSKDRLKLSSANPELAFLRPNIPSKNTDGALFTSRSDYEEIPVDFDINRLDDLSVFIFSIYDYDADNAYFLSTHEDSELYRHLY